MCYLSRKALSLNLSMIFSFFIYISAFIVLRSWFCRGKWSFTSVISDILIAVQLASLGSLSSWARFFLLGSAIPYALLDRLLSRSVGLRMRLSLSPHIKQWRSFWESAKELGIKPFLGFFIIWLLFSVGFSIFVPFTDSKLAAMTLFLASTGCLVFFLNLSAHKCYEELHPLALEQVEAWRNLFKKEKNLLGNWQPKEESFFCPSQDFPLFRFTRQFNGNPHFSLSLAEKKPHILFVFMESFRAKSTAACDPKTPSDLTPCFNQIAKQGVLWPQFYCASARSYKAIIAALFGISCEVDEVAFKKPDDFPLRGLPEILKEGGYFNALIQGGDLDFDGIGEFVKAHQFDLFEGMQEVAARYETKVHGNFWGVSDEFLMKRALEVLKEKDKQGIPSFINLFTISNHHPWRLPSQESMNDSSHEERFQRTLHYADACLGSLIQELDKEGLLEKSLVFLFGDHGQAFSEHGNQSLDRSTLFDEQIKVPLLFLAKGTGLIPQEIEEVASQQDLVPTILDMLNIKTFHHSLGRSLCREKKEADAMFHAPFFPRSIGMRKGRWKWIFHPETGKEELYDLHQDPSEYSNVAYENSLLAQSLHKEGIARAAFLKGLFDKRRIMPSSEKKEEHILDFSGQRELTEEEFIDVLKKMSPKVLKIDQCDALSDEALYKASPFCSQVKILSLRNCLRITTPALKAICQSAKELSELDISHCLCLEEGLEDLFDQEILLRRLSIEGHLFLKGGAIVKILQKTPKLRRLSLLDSPNLSDRDVDAFFDYCRELQFIHLDARNLTDASLASIAKKAPHLIGIYLTHCQEVTDRGLALLVDCPNLSSVILIDCPKAEGGFLKHWKRLFLHRLYLSQFPLLGGESLEALLNHPLQHVQLHECPKINDEGIKRLSELGAKSIHVVGCEAVSREAIDHLRNSVERVFWG
jgi:hypothetical protein